MLALTAFRRVECIRSLRAIKNMNFQKKIKSHHMRELFVYGLVGVAALVVQVGLYTLLCKIGSRPLNANFVGWVFGLVVAYFGHTKLTFRRTHHFSRAEFIKFILGSLTGLAINSLGVFVLVHLLKFSPMVGVIPQLFSPAVTFLISKFWAFA
ncbi:MAG: GtrA family protein [Bacteroidia bacterium]|nr:MAG: GtrA family protein [Bacteroidia bacterium]